MIRYLRTTLFCAITQRVVIILYRRFGTTCRSHVQLLGFLTLEDKTDGLSLKSVKYTHYTLRDIPEECSSHLHRGESLKYP
jgi:hypothetical protein